MADQKSEGGTAGTGEREGASAMGADQRDGEMRSEGGGGGEGGAPDPGSPGGMGGAGVEGATGGKGPPGGVSPVRDEEG
ncbi:MAG TPA: hypothetical protein VF574_04830 [Allosphingosinicella sp.]|jgi:hypothetical protein